MKTRVICILYGSQSSWSSLMSFYSLLSSRFTNTMILVILFKVLQNSTNQMLVLEVWVRWVERRDPSVDHWAQVEAQEWQVQFIEITDWKLINLEKMRVFCVVVVLKFCVVYDLWMQSFVENNQILWTVLWFSISVLYFYSSVDHKAHITLSSSYSSP